MLLVEHADWDGDDVGSNARPSLETLAELGCVDTRSVRRALQLLQEPVNGYLECVAKWTPRRPAVYRICREVLKRPVHPERARESGRTVSADGRSVHSEWTGRPLSGGTERPPTSQIN